METLDVAGDGRIEVCDPGEVNRGDDYIYWGFGVGVPTALATHAGLRGRHHQRDADD